MDGREAYGFDPRMMGAYSNMMGGYPGMEREKYGKKKANMMKPEKDAKLDTSNFDETNGDDFKPDIEI